MDYIYLNIFADQIYLVFNIQSDFTICDNNCPGGEDELEMETSEGASITCHLPGAPCILGRRPQYPWSPYSLGVSCGHQGSIRVRGHREVLSWIIRISLFGILLFSWTISIFSIWHNFQNQKLLVIDIWSSLIYPENTVAEAVCRDVPGVTARVTVTRVKTSSFVTHGNARRTSSSVTNLACVLTPPWSAMDTMTVETMTGSSSERIHTFCTACNIYYLLFSIY